jgi:hypothetical protein
MNGRVKFKDIRLRYDGTTRKIVYVEIAGIYFTPATFHVQDMLSALYEKSACEDHYCVLFENNEIVSVEMQ